MYHNTQIYNIEVVFFCKCQAKRNCLSLNIIGGHSDDKGKKLKKHKIKLIFYNINLLKFYLYSVN